MAEPIVDLLQAVQIDEEHAERVMFALGHLEGLRCQLEESATILELREIVHERKTLQELGIAPKRLFALAKRDIRTVPVNGDFDRRTQLDLLEGLQDIA
jgi:hypothetical protein